VKGNAAQKREASEGRGDEIHNGRRDKEKTNLRRMRREWTQHPKEMRRSTQEDNEQFGGGRGGETYTGLIKKNERGDLQKKGAKSLRGRDKRGGGVGGERWIRAKKKLGLYGRTGRYDWEG